MVGIRRRAELGCFCEERTRYKAGRLKGGLAGSWCLEKE